MRILVAVCAVSFVVLIPAAAWAQATDVQRTASQREDFRLKLDSEFGLLNVLQNDIQINRDGSTVSLTDDAGQDIFFRFLRLSAEALLAQRHTVKFLYQPLDLRTRSVFVEDETVGGVVFPMGTPVDVRYGFDFYRLSYQYDIFRSERLEVGVGGGFQIRLSRQEFTSVDGSLAVSRRNIGPVPLLRARASYKFDNGWFVGSEIDGFYANIRIANGSTDAEVEGSILDWSVRGGKQLRPGLSSYLALRYLGGGARGDNPSDAGGMFV
ncbi:MAG: hypothetical protein AAGI01_13670, partial [Myxococcota bacterium]